MACGRVDHLEFSLHQKSTTSASFTLVDQGKVAYQTHCTACHNLNPKVDGAVGPAIFGSSHELLEHRLLRGAYPQGYTPKRSTGNMPAMPYLKDSIPALHAYLNTP